MTTIDRSALLPFTANQLFELVADIEQYPRFLPGCEQANILERDSNRIIARLGLSRAGFRHSFVTRNTMEPDQHIELRLVDGPFEHFEGRWDFTALSPEACKVALKLTFRMRGGLIHAAAGRLFDKVAVDLVDAVVTRAHTIYGKQTA